jgi:hypothetical protein
MVSLTRLLISCRGRASVSLELVIDGGIILNKVLKYEDEMKWPGFI